MKFLQNQRIMILGLGISGLAMARWCYRFGAKVTVVDTRSNPPQLEQLKNEMSNVQFICSEFQSQFIETREIQLLLVSPGIKPSDTTELIAIAREKNIRIGNELTLFQMALTDLKEKNQYQPNILAITGTNGKTTVTSLTGKLVACANKSVAVAGNIGPSLLDTLSEKLDAIDLPEVWVLELSSFQLNDISDFEPTASVLLNVTQDHLDWHIDMASYVEAKSKVYGSNACMIVNRDDPTVLSILANAQTENKFKKYYTFGSNLPTRLGDYGLESVNGITWLVRAASNEEVSAKKQRSLLETSIDLHMQRLIPAEALQIRGQHNMLNALAALALVDVIGCSISKILYGLRTYKGEPHRVESIGVFNDVEYFDDSKGTNVGAAVAAISGLGIDKNRKIIVILGGDGKGQDFSALEVVVRKFVRAVILIGKDKALIGDALKEINVPKASVETMMQAVESASEFAHAGDIVLLSPACASLDMFENYVHRGQVFKAAIYKLFDTAKHEVNKSIETSEEIKL